MSIATSVVVRPSRLLSMMLIAMSIFLLMSALLLLRSPFDQTVLVFRQLLALVCVGSSFYSFLCSVRSRKIFFIDISGTGVIRLRQTDQVALPESPELLSDPQDSGEVVQLLGNSTLWSMLLLLRFQLANGSVKSVIICPDSLDEVAFRTLSTACRWIAGQNTATSMSLR